jgi:uncharacterized protein (UPF0332 family)
VAWEDYLAKAEENLEVAELALERKKYNASASRAYYAVFQAAVAALLKLTDFRPKDDEWKHAQVQAELNRRLIMRRKVLSGHLGHVPMDLLEIRHTADYRPQMLGQKIAREALSKAREFIKAVRNSLGGIQ